MIFAPPTQMHLRNLIYTYLLWKNAEQVDNFAAFRASVANKNLKELRKQLLDGRFANLPKGC